MVPLLSYQKLLGHVEGSSSPPCTTILIDAKEVPNPVYATWFDCDQWANILLHYSLTENVIFKNAIEDHKIES